MELAIAVAPRALPSAASAIRERAAVLSVWAMCFAPLAWIPGAANMWIFGKALLVALAILLGVISGARGGVPRSILTLGAVGLGVFLVAALHTDHLSVSLLGRYPRYEGLPMLTLYAGALWLGTTVAPGSAARRALPDALASAMTALATATLAELLGHNPLRLHAVRSGSLLGNATDQGLVAMMATVVLAGPAYRRRDPLLALGALSSAFVLAVSGSRAALLGILAAGLVIIASRGRRFALSALLAPVAVLGIALAVPLTRARFTDGFSIDARFQIWGMTRRVIAQHPLLGVGPSGYIDQIGHVETVAWAHGAGRDNAILDSPHSWVLQLVADAGVLGGLVAVALVVVVVRAVWRAVRSDRGDDLTPGLSAAVIGFGVGLLVNFTIIGSTAPAAFLLGVLLAPRATRAARTFTRVAAVLALGAVLATASATAAEVEFTRGLRAASQGHIQRGRSLIGLAGVLRPGDADMTNLAADALSGSTAPHVHDAVLAWAAHSQSATPGTYRSALAVPVSDIAAGQYDAAIARLAPVIRDYPNRALPLIQRAIAELRLDDLSDSGRDLLAARHLAPHDAHIPPLLAEVRAGQTVSGSR